MCHSFRQCLNKAIVFVDEDALAFGANFDLTGFATFLEPNPMGLVPLISTPPPEPAGYAPVYTLINDPHDSNLQCRSSGILQLV